MKRPVQPLAVMPVPASWYREMSFAYSVPVKRIERAMKVAQAAYPGKTTKDQMRFVATALVCYSALVA